MLDIKTYVYGKLTGSSSLIAAVGSTDHIFFGWPQTFETLPTISFREEDQSGLAYFDDSIDEYRSTIIVDLFTSSSVSTTTIANLIDNVMTNIFFALEFSSDVLESDSRLNHRSIRYSRAFLSTAELI